MKLHHFILLLLILLLSTNKSSAQSIKVYFNQPVNTTVSNGIDAIYLNDAFDDSIAAYINRAMYSVDIAMYNFTTGTNTSNIGQAVNNAYNRGVQIRWVYNGSSSNTGMTTLNPNIPTIGSPSSSQYGIMHNKFMVIDINHPDTSKTIVFSGSCNWTEQQLVNDYNNIVFIQSKQVAQAFLTEFNEMWGSMGMQPDPINSKFGPYKTNNTQHVFTVDGKQLEVYFSPSDQTESHLLDIISSANTNLNFGVYAFTRTSIADSIIAAYNRGVYVAGILDNFSSSYAPKSMMAPYLMNQLLTFTLTYVYHHKFVIADACNNASDPTVGSGSHNWSLSAETKNDENFVVFHDAAITNQFYQSFYANAQLLGLTIPSCNSITNVSNIDYQLPRLFPNPVSSHFNIESTDAYSWLIKNNVGQVVKSGKNQNTDIHELKDGLYLLQVKINDQYFNYRLMKQ
jgi:phosphatidylserine/phosphatidylglycerophosphate/cardiolipin synthase-like enzyme